ncbi:chorismate synthase 1, chloroplastic-like isoform X1 [Henckelia pumila]|uniref:chorismate synthase 1, chloroplastic-like isoform X1 n=1 Tax=Henckelia pumila TaxID=405737 RepID=UPI003C6E518D
MLFQDSGEIFQDFIRSRAYNKGVRSMQDGRAFFTETTERIAAGVAAQYILKRYSKIEVLGYVSQVHNLVLPQGLVDHTLTLDQIMKSDVRCPNPEYAEKMIAAINSARVIGDSVGGVVTCVVRNVPWRYGSLSFHEIGAKLAKAVISLPSTTGFEFGSGFGGTFKTGSEYNDFLDVDDSGQVKTRTNQSGGISNEETIKMRIAFKPLPTISTMQNPVSLDKDERELGPLRYHASCVVPGAVIVVEAMVAQVLLGQLFKEFLPWLKSQINAVLEESLKSTKSGETHTDSHSIINAALEEFLKWTKNGETRTDESLE